MGCLELSNHEQFINNYIVNTDGMHFGCVIGCGMCPKEIATGARFPGQPIGSKTFANACLLNAATVFAGVPTHDVPCEAVPEPSAYVAWSIIGVTEKPSDVTILNCRRHQGYLS